jgi:hypothetical protein
MNSIEQSNPPVRERQKSSWEERFVQEHRLPSNLTIAKAFWSRVEGTADHILTLVSKNGKVGREQLAEALEARHLNGEQGQILAALYDNFEAIKSLRQQNLLQEIFADPTIGKSDIGNLAQTAETAEELYHRTARMAYFAEDRKMLDKLFGKRAAGIQQKDLVELLSRDFTPNLNQSSTEDSLAVKRRGCTPDIWHVLDKMYCQKEKA